MKLLLTSLIVFTSSMGLATSASYVIRSGTGNTASGIQTTSGLTFRTVNPANLAQTPTNIGDAYPVGGGNWGGPGVVGWGYFSTDSLTTLNNVQLIAAFTPIVSSSSFLAHGTTGNRSVYNQSITNFAITGTEFAGKNQYIFAGNGDTFANSTEFLVVKTQFLFNAADDLVATPITNTVRPNDAESSLLLGSVVTNVQTANTDVSTTAGWQMAAVTVIPEPSAALLGAVGAMLLLRRRRI